jgi:hypothetical protein
MNVEDISQYTTKEEINKAIDYATGQLKILESKVLAMKDTIELLKEKLNFATIKDDNTQKLLKYVERNYHSIRNLAIEKGLKFTGYKYVLDEKDIFLYFGSTIITEPKPTSGLQTVETTDFTVYLESDGSLGIESSVYSPDSNTCEDIINMLYRDLKVFQ